MKIQIESTPAPADEQVVRDGLWQYNEGYFSGAGDVAVAVFLRDVDGAIRGGALGKAGRGWLHVGALWVDAGLRGNGYGSQLMAAIDVEGRKRGCHSAYLDTFSFQARPFYEGCGYDVFGVLEAFPDEHQRFFMVKSLV